MEPSSLSSAVIQLNDRIKPFASLLKESLDRRMQGPVIPNAELRFSGLPVNRKESLLVGIASWWLNDVGILLRLELENSQEVLVRLACSSKAAALEILQDQFSERDFFGNFLPRLTFLLEKIDLVYQKPKRVSKTVRRRGYRDHGTLRPEHQKHRDDMDIDLIELQNNIEQLRLSTKDTDQFLLGLMGII